MCNTRRFKALNGAKGEYSRIVDKIAVYDDNGNQIDCCIIQRDKEGREYYRPNNLHDKMGSFLERPKDAIDCIRNGFGDGFLQSYLFGMSLESVVRFIDREYGEEIRQKTLEGWKNAKFAFAVSFTYLNSFSGGRKVCENKCLYGYGDKLDDILIFNTELDAQAFIADVYKRAERYVEEYLKLPKSDDRDYDQKYIYEPFFDRISEEMESGVDSVYWRAFSGTKHEKETGEKEYAMKVVQVVLP